MHLSAIQSFIDFKKTYLDEINHDIKAWPELFPFGKKSFHKYLVAGAILSDHKQ